MYIPESGRYSGTENLNLEVKRQIFHLVLISLWLVPILLFPYPLALITFVLVIAINLAVVLKLRPFYQLFSFLLEHLERERNLDRPGIQALYANLGVFLSFLLFGELSMFGVIALSVGDSLSTLIGKHFGRHKIFFNGAKSWEGSFAFFLGSFLAFIFITDHRTALLLSSLSALVEALDLRIDDNLVIPLFVSALAYLV